MENHDRELIQKLIPSNPDLKRYMEEHAEFERQLAELNRRLYLTPEEEVERKRIQKLKLSGRDKIEAILSQYRSQSLRGER